MKEYRIMRLLNLHYLYYLVLMLMTTYLHWFDGSPFSGVLLLVIVFFPFFIGKVLYRKKVITKQIDERKAASCHIEYLSDFFVLSMWGGFSYDNIPNHVICCLFYMAAFCIYIYSKYYYGKYLVLGCNPSVTRATQKRAEQGSLRSFRRLLVISVLISLALLVLLGTLPEVAPYTPKFVKHEKPKIENQVKIPQEKKNPKKEEFQELEKKEEGVFSVIIRYILLLTVAVGIVYLLFLFLYKILSLMAGRHRKGAVYEYEEKVVERQENEEYVALIPRVREKRQFPDGNNGRIRRKFYQKVRRGAGRKSVQESYTPSELRDNYLGEGEGDLYLTELYERVRYSPDFITDDEIRRWERLEKRG